MAETIEVRVPNIGDFKDVPVIDVLVKPGDSIGAEDPLVTLESEKATMDVPSPSAGVVRDVTVKIGDKVSEGSALLTLSSAATAGGNGAAPSSASTPASSAPSTPNAAPSPPPAAPVTTTAPTSAPSAGATAEALEVRVPNIGDFKDVPVIDVLVKPGDTVAAEDPLITLESEKATLDVPAPQAGVVRDLAVKVGDKVSEGSSILTLQPEGAAAKTEAAAAPTAAAATAAPSGDGVAAPRAAEPTRAAAPAVSAPEAKAPSGEAAHASPSVRRFARELGVELATVSGTGPKGRVTREDVQGFVKRVVATPSAGATTAGPGLNLPPWPKVDFAQFGPIETKPLPRIKKISGPVLARNWVMIPHVTNNDEADITDLEAFRRQINEQRPDAKLTILAFLMRAVVAALQRFPDFNASLDGENLILKRYYHLGFAADTPNGLVVPVVRDVDQKGVLAIAAETRDLAAKARDGKLTLAQMQGGTFTISSLGGIGGTSFSPIINAPEVAILGVSRSAMRPVYDGHAFAPRLLLPLSLSYDHRVIDGAAAARFNAYLGELLADMRRTLL